MKINRKLIWPLLMIIFIGIFFKVKLNQRQKQGELKTVSPIKTNLIESVYGVGIAKTNLNYDIQLAISSVVANVFVSEGDVVKKNAPLIRFEDTGIFSAPFSGVITAVNVQKGEMSSPPLKAISLSNYDSMYFEMTLDQDSAILVKKNQNVKLRFEKLLNQTFETKVAKIFPKDNSFVVHTKPIKLPEAILPGMTADASIEVQEKNNIFVLPLKAIYQDHISILEGDKIKKKPVKLGIVREDRAEILTPHLNETMFILLNPESYGK